ncbi:MAG: glycosyltransferase [Mariprofundales bacterium]
MIKFSIAIPIYNQQQFLPTALKSIKVQNASYQLAVMDATPDDSVQNILDKYNDIIYYRRHGKDGGQSEAIQEGWDNTDADIIAWLCADDYYFPDTLASVQKVFEEYPEVDVVYGDSVFVDINKQFKMYFPAIENDVSCLPVHDCIAQPSCFIRRTAFKRINGLDFDLHYIMDWDLWIRLYESGAKFHYLHKPLSVTSVYPETKTSSMSLRRYQEINQQLKMQPSLLRRIRGLVGMLHYDLKTDHRNFALKLLLVFLNTYKYTTNKLSSNKAKYLYGLEVSTNRIIDHCSIMLPFYSSQGIHQIIILTSPYTKITLKLNENKLLLDRRDGDLHIFTLSNYMINQGQVLDFQIKVQSSCYLTSFILD